MKRRGKQSLGALLFLLLGLLTFVAPRGCDSTTPAGQSPAPVRAATNEPALPASSPAPAAAPAITGTGNGEPAFRLRAHLFDFDATGPRLKTTTRATGRIKAPPVSITARGSNSRSSPPPVSGSTRDPSITRSGCRRKWRTPPGPDASSRWP